MALARSAVKAARSAGDWKRMTVSIESVARRSTGLGKYDLLGGPTKSRRGLPAELTILAMPNLTIRHLDLLQSYQVSNLKTLDGALIPSHPVGQCGR